MPIALSAMEVETDAPMSECPVGEGRIREFLEAAERRRPQLLRMARRLTNSNEDAEDILQEAFMKAYKALAKFRGESQMSSWLGAIVQNTAHEHLRSRRNRVFVSIEYLNREDNEVVELDLPDPGKNPEETWQSREIETILREEVKKLGLVCRRAIEMCVLEEHPQLAAASALNLSVATMKSRVFRGKRLLGRAVSRRLGAQHGALAMAADRRVSCEM
ncbi:MAG TPA: RNA polymerase sigma factor [Terracidiphilus sp.]|nr:RNA polymerase sigma factor [Terracidiphilus sp.]